VACRSGRADRAAHDDDDDHDRDRDRDRDRDHDRDHDRDYDRDRDRDHDRDHDRDADREPVADPRHGCARRLHTRSRPARLEAGAASFGADGDLAPDDDALRPPGARALCGSHR
jgi:hypothetical protein